ncbi:hypothetical protein ACSS9F_000908 [Escherichia coli]|uniref:hypothetical protein n=1 Tax=Escherichia coli TaxID=562 RepID=UPI0017FE630C|nr:hypothetical protein [Escherichia coli]EFK3940073.1 hypothetical protein [Escherichia coli]EGM8458341.1 hypothetical protein [Escherichia coli]EHV5987067.1 hypothetical protein [Escherichia coli]EHZ1481282.1 hypothetical protein [Escherichia coli]EIB7322782.1 hypothetical protein [Escherichia coli]
MIYYGKVVKYFSKDYGFIEGIPFTTSNFTQRNLEVFFHISDIKNEDAISLIKNNNHDDFYFWYSIKKTEKGGSVKNIWGSYADIPDEEIVPLLKGIEFHSEKYGSKYGLCLLEAKQVMHYIEIFKNEKCSEQKHVNDYIDRNGLWGQFNKMASYNDHGEHKNISGITPIFYGIVGQILNMKKGNGNSLTAYRKRSE